MKVVTKKKCSPCAQSAALSYGDAICHHMVKHGARVDCHALLNEVSQGKRTVDDYLAILARSAPSERERNALRELKKLMYEKS